MHELSIAMSLLEMAEAESARHSQGLPVAIHVSIGPLSGVAGEALLSAYELAREGTVLEACRLVLQATAITAHCPRCGGSREVESPQELACAVCGTPVPEILTGREMELTALEFEA